MISEFFVRPLHPHWVGDHGECPIDGYCRQPHSFQLHAARWVHSAGVTRICRSCFCGEDAEVHHDQHG